MGVALSVKVLLSVLYMLMVFLALLVLGWDNYVVAICLLFALENAIKTCYGLLFASFQAHEKMKYQAISNTILNVLTFIFIIIITFTNWELFGIAFAYILANKGVDVIDCGVPVLSMHAPYEVTSKFDIFEAYRAYKAFWEKD